MGSDLRFDYEVRGVEKTARRIRRGLREGMEEAADDLVGKGKDAARSRIYRRRRIWNKEVYQYGWYEDVQTLSPTRVQGFLANYAQHARVVDEGRRPGATAPQVQHIIEWVDDKVTGGYSFDTDEGGGGPPGRGDRLHSVLNENATVDEVIKAADAGLSQSANTSNIRKVTFEGGDSGIFKPNDLSSSLDGVVQNEEVVHRFAERMGWTNQPGFPASRQRTIVDVDGTEKTGNIQQFVDNPTEVGEVVRNFYDPDGISPERFAEENLDFAARVGVIDYIVSNDDRHLGNILVDGDNTPWAIDSGGHMGPDMASAHRRASRLIAIDDWEYLNRRTPMDGYVIEDPERMYAATNAILDRQEEIFLKIRNDDELREELIEMAESLHEDGTVWTGHYRDVLDFDGNSPIFKDDGAIEPWEEDIDIIRQAITKGLNERVDELQSDPDVDSPWQSDPLNIDNLEKSNVQDEINERLNYLLGDDEDYDDN